MTVLLDEMYPIPLAEALRAAGVDTCAALELRLAGSSDEDLFSLATERGWTILTENVADFARMAAERLTAGQHHPGVLIALSSHFSRRPAGIGALVTAVLAVTDERLEDRTVYLK